MSDPYVGLRCPSCKKVSESVPAEEATADGFAIMDCFECWVYKTSLKGETE